MPQTARLGGAESKRVNAEAARKERRNPLAQPIAQLVKTGLRQTFNETDLILVRVCASQKGETVSAKKLRL